MDNAQVAQPADLSQKISAFLEKNLLIYQFLRFGCIGALNTALNFLILNGISKALGISQGWGLGAVDVVSFAAAVVQSYLWNRTWTFGNEQGVSLFKNFVRLLEVGLLGTLAVIFVLVGSKFSAPYLYYVGILAVYLILEAALWRHFNFHNSNWNHEGNPFAIFFAVTLIGLGINALLTGVISQHLHLFNPDLNKNVALILATGVSLFWNFIGYKVIVFKK